MTNQIQLPDTSTVIIAGENAGKTALLKQIARVAEDFYVITGRPEEWSGESGMRNCSGVVAWHSRESSDLIMRLAGVGNQRQFGRNMGDQVFLLVDHLSLAATRIDFEPRINLEWLVRNGAENEVYCYAAYNPMFRERGLKIFARPSANLIPNLLDQFGTTINGVRRGEFGFQQPAGNLVRFSA